MTRDQLIIKLMEIYVSHRAYGTMGVAPEIWYILKQEDDDPSQPTWLFWLPIGAPVCFHTSSFPSGKTDVSMVTQTSPGESASVEDFGYYEGNIGEYDDG